jgi:plastocyanin
MAEYLLREGDDGIDRRGFLKCMAWAGTGLLWTVSGGVLSSRPVHEAMRGVGVPSGELSFVQISDSHIGFSKEANPDVIGTLRAALARIDALPGTPAFMLHTGDLTHLSKPEEFDTLDQVLRDGTIKDRFFVPGEHDVIDGEGKEYRRRYGRGTIGEGWYSFDRQGVHFIGLVNVLNLAPGGLGRLGEEQLAWLEKDLSGRSSSTPVVLFAHMPLWSIYPDWGWGTDDAARALALLKRFGSVTVLNGHIHQVMQKVEGNVTFHTAASTAFVQPRPGEGPSPGPMKVEPGRLRSLLGVTSVTAFEGRHSLAVIDTPLVGAAPSTAAAEAAVAIENFVFKPQSITVEPGSRVTWTNRDDAPHTVVSRDKVFASKGLDTGERYSFTFEKPGIYPYYCSLHPHMTGSVTVG